MAISIVNGYYCANGCDAAKAKKGEDPHPSTDQSGIKDKGKDNNSLQADGPAVVFGGALSALSALRTDAVQPTQSTSAADPAAARRAGQVLDVLA